MRDLNIDAADKTKYTCNYLSDLCDIFSLKNIVNGKTCFKGQKSASIDVLLANRPRSLHKTGIFGTGFSDQHKLILLYFVLTFHVFHLKLSNIEIKKTLMKSFSP